MKKLLCAAALVVASPCILYAVASSADAATYGNINGTITGVGPVPDSVRVTAYLKSGAEFNDEAEVAVVNGAFTIPHVRTGTYNLCFDASFEDGDSEQGWCVSTATGAPTTFNVTPDTTTTAPAVKYSAVTGTVTGTGASGGLDAGVASYLSNARDFFDYGTGYAETNSSGAYVLPFQPVVGLKLRVEPPTTAYAPEWWNNASSYGKATVLRLSASMVSTANVQLAVSSTLKGTLTLPAGATEQDALVTVLDAKTGEELTYGGASRSSNSSSRGKFTIKGLAAGTYKVAFGRASGSAKAPARFYKGVKEQSGVSKATSVTLTAGGSKSIADSLKPSDGGKVTGTVYRTVKGKKVVAKGYLVVAWRADNKLTTRSATTNSKGTFSIAGVAPGSYKIDVYTPAYVPKTYKSVTVRAGKSTSTGKLTR